jgi:sirohydrochlorin ferrochelatase
MIILFFASIAFVMLHTTAFPNSRVIGIILVDHGSRVQTANQDFEQVGALFTPRPVLLPFQFVHFNVNLLAQLAAQFRRQSGHTIVEPAHMEMAEPTIMHALKKCVEQGATTIVCHPYFLSNGRHVREDIPALLSAASAANNNVPYTVTPPIGMQPEMLSLIAKSVSYGVLEAEGGEL